MNDIYNILLEKIDYVSYKLSEIRLSSKRTKTMSSLDNMLK